MSDPGTPGWLATHNDRAALRLLLAHGPLSRLQLSALSGLSKPTAGQMITRLERIGLIAPAGEVSGQRGPSAVAWGVRADALTGVAVSVLGDRLQAVLVDPTGAEHPMVELATDGWERSPALDVSTALDAACAAAGTGRDSVAAVAIGVQAAVDATADALSHTDTLPGWPDHGSRALIEAATGLNVVLDNDVNLAAGAERAEGVAPTSPTSPTCGSARASASTRRGRSVGAPPAAPAKSATSRCPVRPPGWRPTPSTTPTCWAVRRSPACSASRPWPRRCPCCPTTRTPWLRSATGSRWRSPPSPRCGIRHWWCWAGRRGSPAARPWPLTSADWSRPRSRRPASYRAVLAGARRLLVDSLRGQLEQRITEA